MNGFWSLTIYDHFGKLVPNNYGITYNAIGGAMVQGHSACFNPDGSLDLYLQSTPPAAGIPYCNWLPTPTDAAGNPYIAFLRMYWPKEAILQKDWTPPPIVTNN